MLWPEVLLTLLVAPVIFCCDSYFDTGCICPDGHPPTNETDCEARTLSEEDITWLVDPSGRLVVKFPLHEPNCVCHCYTLELFVYEARTEEQCKGVLQPTSISHHPHSRKKYAIVPSCPAEHSCHQICEKVGEVTFQYVFTGCYQLVIQPKSKKGTAMKSFSWGKYLYTNYLKKLVAGTKPNVTFQNLPALQQTSITFQVEEHVARSYKIDLNQSIWCMHCTNTACQCDGCHKHLNCDADHQRIQCSIRDDKINLVFIGLSPGQYCLYVDITEDRCQPSTLWTTTESNTALVCNWHHDFEVLQTMPNNAPKNDDYFSRYYIILGVLCAIVVAAIIIALFAMRSYIVRHQSRTTLTVLPSSLIPLEPNRILLLYSRDCQPFMQLMATFREVLEDLAKYEVIDCLDASRWNEIGRSPVDWVRNHIEQPGTKVVLVATQCAYLRQQAYHKQVSTHYKDPASHDNLFIYALKTLTENLSPDVYRKVCVVRFEGFSDDKNLFSHLTPYMRFVLPLHLQQLISNLRPSASQEQNEQLIENKEVQKLIQDLTQLITYKNKNITYLQDILSIQRNEES